MHALIERHPTPWEAEESLLIDARGGGYLILDANSDVVATVFGREAAEAFATLPALLEIAELASTNRLAYPLAELRAKARAVLERIGPQ